MSVDRNVYLGPYAECVFKTEKRAEEHSGCVNPKCKAHKKESGDSFCSKCGQAIGKFVVMVDDDAPDVMDLTGETLTDADSGSYDNAITRTFVIPNVDRAGAPPEEDVEDLDGAVDLLGRDMGAECMWFARTFAVELDALRPAFASVDLKWGLLQWFS